MNKKCEDIQGGVLIEKEIKPYRAYHNARYTVHVSANSC